MAAADHQGPGSLSNAGQLQICVFSLVLACHGWLARTAASRWKRSRHRTAMGWQAVLTARRRVLGSLRWPRSQGGRQRSRSESRGHRAPVMHGVLWSVAKALLCVCGSVLPKLCQRSAVSVSDPGGPGSCPVQGRRVLARKRVLIRVDSTVLAATLLHGGRRTCPAGHPAASASEPGQRKQLANTCDRGPAWGAASALGSLQSRPQPETISAPANSLRSRAWPAVEASSPCSCGGPGQNTKQRRRVARSFARLHGSSQGLWPMCRSTTMTSHAMMMNGFGKSFCRTDF